MSILFSLPCTDLTIHRNLKDVRDLVKHEDRKNHLGLLFYSKSQKAELQRLATQFEDTLQLFQIGTLLSLQETLEHVTMRLQHMDHSIMELANVASLPPTEVAGDPPGVPVCPSLPNSNKDKRLTESTDSVADSYFTSEADPQWQKPEVLYRRDARKMCRYESVRRQQS
ncbi:uncharacterized protein ARMOST_08535 [Armillaria ostoyae]|uniref:Uncharacterized protein n=1 Tax=Armillaria ostoyae TaxID=47428 RepID=A0A284R8Z7_ARMOS|nr:uncharacterized protein ARMOST_08535 [Armillaria ostoyae]